MVLVQQDGVNVWARADAVGNRTGKATFNRSLSFVNGRLVWLKEGKLYMCDEMVQHVRIWELLYT